MRGLCVRRCEIFKNPGHGPNIIPGFLVAEEVSLADCALEIEFAIAKSRMILKGIYN